MAANRPIERKILAAILWLYIILCFVIAGLNYGVAGQASPFFMTWWLFAVAGYTNLGIMDRMAQLEVIKYLSLELLMAMFFWIVWTGRGYCFYCPLGTFLSLVARVAGQRIRTDATKCIGCNKCNRACPMQIDLATPARTGEPFTA